jgi:hypothetical protein
MGAATVMLQLALAGAPSITPSGGELPANLLRFEVHFEHAMPGMSAQSIVLRDGAGRPLADALLDLVLPDGDERTLVVLMQPGRIKHGVGPNLALGPALHEGERVTLVVRVPRLTHPLRRSWRITAPVTGPLVPAAWRLHAPVAGGRAPLVLDLPSPINAGGAALIAVAGPDGRRVAGTARLTAGETRWRFVPATPWQQGAYQVRVHTDLEDPAGNRMCAPFEERLQSRRDCSAGASVDFIIGAPYQSRLTVSSKVRGGL